MGSAVLATWISSTRRGVCPARWVGWTILRTRPLSVPTNSTSNSWPSAVFTWESTAISRYWLGCLKKSIIVSHWVVDSESMRSQNDSLKKKCGKSILVICYYVSHWLARGMRRKDLILKFKQLQLCKWEGKRRKEYKFGIGEIYVRFACIFLGS